jgi:hypothetical protein
VTVKGLAGAVGGTHVTAATSRDLVAGAARRPRQGLPAGVVSRGELVESMGQLAARAAGIRDRRWPGASEG